MRAAGESALAWVVSLLAVYLGYAYIFSPRPALEPDSWTFLELARSVFGDFYRIGTHRQYFVDTDYGIFFPPLWPLLIALYNAISGGGGLLSGVLLSRLIALFTVIPCVVLFRLLSGESAAHGRRGLYLGLIVWMSLILSPYYMEEVNDGRSIPLGVMLGLSAACMGARLWRIALPDGHCRAAAGIGLLAGLMMLTRFDCTLLAALAGLLLWLHYGLRAAACYAAGVLVGVLPWISFSWSHFHRLYMTDNQFVALAVPYIYVLDFHNSPVQTLFDAPLQWVLRVFGNLTPTLAKLLGVCLGDLLTLIMLLGVGSILWAGQRPLRATPRGAFYVLAVLVAMLGPILLTGYFGAARYFVAPVLFITIVCAAKLCRAETGDQSVEMIITLGIVLGMVALGMRPYGGPLLPWNFTIVPLDDYRADMPCLPPDARVAMGSVSRALKERDPFQFGYRTGLTTFVMPTNWLRLSRGEQKAFTERFGITHVISANPSLVPGMVPTHCSMVYTVSK